MQKHGLRNYYYFLNAQNAYQEIRRMVEDASIAFFSAARAIIVSLITIIYNNYHDNIMIRHAPRSSTRLIPAMTWFFVQLTRHTRTHPAYRILVRIGEGKPSTYIRVRVKMSHSTVIGRRFLRVPVQNAWCVVWEHTSIIHYHLHLVHRANFFKTHDGVTVYKSL